VVYSVLWLVGIVQIASAEEASSTSRAVGIALISGHLALLGWFVGHRVARPGVLVGSQAVIIRNPTRSYRLAWADIGHFSVEPNGSWTIGQVRTKGGKSIRISESRDRSRAVPNSAWAEGSINELNALLADGAGTPDE
jgi:hypothetical protein